MKGVMFPSIENGEVPGAKNLDSYSSRLKFMDFLADLKNFHFEGQEVVSKLGSPFFPL